MIFRALLKTFLMFIGVLIFILLIIFMPREPDVIVVDQVMHFEYELDWQEYYDNISGFMNETWENRSLGTVSSGQTIEESLSTYIPRSLQVIIAAFLFSVPVGILKGTYDFRNQYRQKRWFGNGLTSVVQAIPDFFMIIMVQMIIIRYIPVVSVFGHDDWYSFILPAFMVSIYPAMYMAKITSTSLGAQEHKPYIQTAQSKGITEMRIVYKHMLSNCLTTMGSHLSTIMLFILTNLLIVEYLMDYKGAAYRLFQAIDYSTNITPGNIDFEGPLIFGLTFFFLIVVFVSHIITQIVKHTTNPK